MKEFITTHWLLSLFGFVVLLFLLAKLGGAGFWESLGESIADIDWPDDSSPDA